MAGSLYLLFRTACLSSCNTYLMQWKSNFCLEKKPQHFSLCKPVQMIISQIRPWNKFSFTICYEKKLLYSQRSLPFSLMETQLLSWCMCSWCFFSSDNKKSEHQKIMEPWKIAVLIPLKFLLLSSQIHPRVMFEKWKARETSVKSTVCKRVFLLNSQRLFNHWPGLNTLLGMVTANRREKTSSFSEASNLKWSKTVRKINGKSCSSFRTPGLRCSGCSFLGHVPFLQHVISRKNVPFSHSSHTLRWVKNKNKFYPWEKPCLPKLSCVAISGAKVWLAFSDAPPALTVEHWSVASSELHVLP